MTAGMLLLIESYADAMGVTPAQVLDIISDTVEEVEQEIAVLALEQAVLDAPDGSVVPMPLPRMVDFDARGNYRGPRESGR